MNIIKRMNLVETKWTGGTTTELFIAPENADYIKRQFLMRISTATVVLKESTFTPLPGVKRHLMILEGDMMLKHKNHYEKNLGPYEQDFFWGDFETSSVSERTVVDFNLMLKGDMRGELKHYSIKKEQTLESAKLCNKCMHRGFYCHKGKATIGVNDKIDQIGEGDYIYLSALEYNQNLKIIGAVELIEVTVWSD